MAVGGVCSIDCLCAYICMCGGEKERLARAEIERERERESSLMFVILLQNR